MISSAVAVIDTVVLSVITILSVLFVLIVRRR